MRLISLFFQFIYTVHVYIVWCLMFFFHWLVSVCVIWFTPSPARACIRLCFPFLALGFWLTGVRYEVKGAFDNDLDNPVLIISNHQSLLDIGLLYLVLRRPFIFVTKKELLRVPILGWDIRLMKQIVVDRQNARVARDQLAQVKDRFMGGDSVVFFAEGTRSVSDRILPFKRGPFLLAVEMGASILPCRIDGANRLINKSSLLMRPGTVHVHLGSIKQVDKVSDAVKQKQAATVLKDEIYRCVSEDLN